MPKQTSQRIGIVFERMRMGDFVNESQVTSKELACGIYAVPAGDSWPVPVFRRAV